MTAIFEGVGSMERALDYHMERQNLISANIANVDTPGYAPRELERLRRSFSEQMSAARLSTTREAHFAGSSAGEGERFAAVREYRETPGNDMNYVSLDYEMSRLSANTLRYQAVSRALSSQLGMLRYGASDGRG